jgi:hypothetical protein
MWILKGMVVGSILCLVFCVAYLRSIVGSFRPNAAGDLTTLTYFTIYKPLFWVALALTVSSGLVWSRLLNR